ncbi:hypothetical protein [Prochlorococcus marinus]|uniref:Uncharacterized protein n=1 Tax=Prochlorococcus marinus (strain MIT 9211) TaxID=93059 RepID=A9BBM1_PROM4|nr:hypothetical protein [Prochlorococcus marinus]ABX09233.1 Hypothetical protein P9211_13021 [Prochlorococcus marinus str. MIT 9211]
MSENNLIFLNASEHLFGLDISETLMLRNYSHVNGFLFCSMMGGSESIRDLQEARNLGVEAYEFPLVESLFSVSKIFLALEKVFSDDLSLLAKHKIFIDICTKDALEMLLDVKKLSIPSFLKRSNLIFNLNRRSLIRSSRNIRTSSYEVSDYENQINHIILEISKPLKDSGHSFSISGGISNQSLHCLGKANIKPDFIKTGLFTISREGFSIDELSRKILNFQSIEAKLLDLMNNSMHFKHSYVNKRQMHMMNFIIESLV